MNKREQAAEIARLRALVDACAPYLKYGETPAERIERERGDNSALLNVLATRTKECEALRAQLAASEAASAQMREALVQADAWIVGADSLPLDETLVVIAAALETDAGRGWVSTEGAVEARVAPIFGPPAYGWVDAHVPAEWGNSVVLIIRKPEES